MMTPRSCRRRLAFAFALTAACVRYAGAQADTGVVSRELVILLLHQLGEGLNSNGRPLIMAGSMPTGLTSQVGMPSGARIAGAVSWPTYTDILGTAPGTVDEVRGWFSSDFAKRGYTPANTGAPMSSMGGFRDPVVGPVTGYCSNNQYYSITARPRDAATAEFRIRVNTNYPPCSMSMGSRGGFVDPTNMPLLYNPPNAPRTNRCFPSYGPGNTNTQFSSAMAPQDILKHYGKQIEEAGWKSASLPSIISGNWVKKDSTGRDMTLTVTVTPSIAASDCRSVTMTIADPSR